MATGVHPQTVQRMSSVWNKRLMIVRRAEAIAQAHFTAEAMKKVRRRQGRHSQQ